MAALTKPRKQREVSMRQVRRVLANLETAFEGAVAMIDLNVGATRGQAVPGKTGTNRLSIGHFIDLPETGLVGNGSTRVAIRLPKEVIAFWYVNATAGAALLDSDFGSVCYLLDDQTVTNSATGNSIAGRVWAVDAVKGVLVEPTICAGL